MADGPPIDTSQEFKDNILSNPIGTEQIDSSGAAIPKYKFGSLRYPPNLGNLLDQSYPFVSFRAIKFRDRWALLENNASSAGVADKPQQKDILGDIHLPLPQDFQNSVAPQWEIADSQILAAGEQVYKALTSGAIIRNAIAGAPALRNELGAIFAGGISKKIRFQTANPKKQAFFGGIEPRSFAFNYSFSPQSLKEAQLIENIIKQFTIHSLPELTSPGDAFFNFPSEFLISFNNTKGFPILSKGNNSCVCTSVSTNYSQAGIMQLLQSGHVVQIGLSLTFTETTIRTKQDPGI